MELTKSAEKLLKRKSEEIKNCWEDMTFSEVINSEVESPIEQLFLIEWYFQLYNFHYPFDRGNFYILPQYKIKIGEKEYKVDFLILYPDPKKPFLGKIKKDEGIIVELDSYLWHGKSPEQFEKEKKRERDLIKEGWQIIRFSGREVVRDIEKCVIEVLNIFRDKKRDEVEKRDRK